MAEQFNYERAAQVLAEAAIYGDAKASQRASLTIRTIQNYRKRLSTDEALSRLFAEKRASLERKWASSLAPAIRSAVAFLQRAAEEADARDPEVIHAIAGAFKLLAGVALTKEVLDSRLNGLSEGDRAGDEGARAVATEDRPGLPGLN